MAPPCGVVMPVYNEAPCIREVCLEWLTAIRQVPGAQLLVVDDGSHDETPSILRELAAEHGALTVLRQQNSGHGPAILHGYHAAIQLGCEWIFQVDSDGQFRASDWLRLWGCRSRSDFVLAARVDRRDGLLRRCLSGIHRMLLPVVFGVWVRDPNVPFRLVKASLLSRLLEMIPGQAFAPNVLLSVAAAKLGYDTCSVPVTHLPRRAGQGSIRPGRLGAIAARCLREMLAFRRALALGTAVFPHRSDAGRDWPANQDILSRYLRTGPIFAALLRSVECEILRQFEPLPEPLLDLGCGDGHFGSLAFKKPVFAGLDYDLRAVRRAAATRAYHHVVCASATHLPFRDAVFPAILANSVLEHIPDVESALRECLRVLQPGGWLVFTAPSHRFAEMLCGSWLLRKAGLAGAANAYGRWFNWHSRHYHADSEREWKARLSQLGLEVEQSYYYLTADTLRVFDLAHYLSVPRLISRKLTGRWVALPRLTLNPIWERWLRRHVTRPRPSGEGPYLFIQARKGRAEH